MRRRRVPPGRVVAFRRGEMAQEFLAPEPRKGEFVEVINALADLWQSGYFDHLGAEATPNHPRRPDLRVVAGTDHDGQRQADAAPLPQAD